ncbi:alanine racemase [Streptomyces sp. NPDC007861]|uniref:alanine racemase n=1 Tax=Streptomyces sp. NPDC007861 TaxID=3154893 RepID=UPI0033E67439
MHRSEITLDLSSVTRNVELLMKHLERAELWAVVKANAYGHGALPVARSALEVGASALCVATVKEGTFLRSSIPRHRIIVMGPVSPADVPTARDANLECVAHDEAMIPLLEREVDFHLKLNTGLNRWGLQAPTGTHHRRMVGVMSQFATDGNPDITARQLADFLDLSARTPGAVRHIANSCAAWLFPETQLDAVRSGCALVGFPPSSDQDFGLRPTLRWSSYLAQTRRVARGERIGYEGAYRVADDAVMGLVPVGYADGFNVNLAGTHVLVGDAPAQVVAVYMDAVAVVLQKEAPTGTPVTLVGDGISLDAHAKVAGIDSWELSAGLIDDPRRTFRRVVG